ncbi:N-acetylmuramoyl-L-alanine amidase [Anaerocolumna jejuensis DSM 15929]|uniref:N-acetylmuramoyl-L-alanine amidase n=1 Tax=Anaerocolumna jejuensis DSM 15929 TaxID=1121322 RepID=A0A1M6K8U9_9FIRM|nr:N-acetylmuramoyl-L-alanine amidase [Anaerocolumna jejuensis]SHJ55323.1 N-acetylmuramoyl-L-alanine amidase [Anaerocolumna jejuensis DSM 15929]
MIKFKNLNFKNNKIQYNDRGKNKHIDFWKSRLTYIMAVVILICFMPVTSAKAAAGLSLYNYQTKQDFTYNGNQVVYTYNGKKIPSKVPGIIIDGTSMASVKEIFADSGIQMAYKLQGEDKLTLSYGKTVMAMTLGSKTVLVNGKTVTAPLAPVKVKFKAQNTSKILVPARFVAESFGFSYQWDGISTAGITGALGLNYNGSDINYTGTQGKVSIDGKTVKSGSIPVIIVDDTALLPGWSVFADSSIKAGFSYNKKTNEVILKKNGTVIKLTIGNKTAYVNGKASVLDTPPLYVTNLSSKEACVMVPGSFIAANLGYDYSWNSGTKTSQITTKSNSGKNNSGQNNNGQDNSGQNNSGQNNNGQNNNGQNNSGQNNNGQSNNGQNNSGKNNNGQNSNGQSNNGQNNNGQNNNGQNSNGDNNNGNQSGTDNTTLPDTDLFLWELLPQLSDGYMAASNAANTKEVSQDGGILSNIQSINLDQVLNGTSQKEVYTIKAAAPLSKTTINTEGNLLKLHINNSYVYAASNNLGGVLAGGYNAVSNTIENYSEISFQLINADTKYEAALSDDKCTLTLTLYPNYINSVAAGRKNGEEFVKITGLKVMPVTVTESTGSIVLQVPYSINGVGNNSSASSLDCIKAVNIANVNDYTTNITINKASGYSYRVEQDQNSYTILFTKGDTSGNGGNTQSALQFKLPQEVNYSDVTTEDRYRFDRNQIAILLPGDLTDFYNSNPVTFSSGVVQNVSVNYVNNQTEILIETSKLQGFRLAKTKSGVSVTLGDPREMYKNIVLLDPGHGSNRAGATRTLNGKKIMEKDLALAILYEKAQKYFNAPDSPIKVYYTRNGDETKYSDYYKELYDRAARAKSVGADLYVSLHMNSSTATSPKGTEIHYSSKNNKANASGLTSRKMAEMFLNNLTANLGTINRGVKDGGIIVVKENTVPAVLIELGFMSNKEELTLLNDPDFQDRAAKSIYDTLCQVFAAYPTGR